jgi:uncharacterized protein involved in exopolysaccharide biosynthesis
MTDHSQGEQVSRQSTSKPSYPRSHPLYDYPSDDEVDLRELWNVIWQGKWLIIVITALFSVGSVVVALGLPNIYRSETLLAPSEESHGGGLTGMAGQLGGLASLAGINLGSAGGDDKVVVAMAVLQSRKFIGEFAERHGLLPELMAVEEWNSSTGDLIYDKDIYLPSEDHWVREVEPPKTPQPSAWEAYEKFVNIMNVSQDKETGLITLAIEHPSPIVAQNWVELLVQDVNRVMKEKDVAEAQRSIGFLQKKLDEVALADMRAVFYQLIEEQTKTIMLAEVRDEYVFTTIDPPVIAEEKAGPKRALICILGTMLGGMLAVIIVFIRHFVRQGRQEQSGRAGNQ